MSTRTISTRLAIEGEAQYKQSVAACNAELKTLKSSLALVESEFRGNANSMDALTAKGSALYAVQGKQKEKLAELEEALKTAQSAAAGYGEKQEQLKGQLEAADQALKGMDGSVVKAGERWAEYAREIQKNEQALAALKGRTGDTSAEQAKLEAAMDRARAQMERLGQSTGGTASEAGELIERNKRLNAEYESNQAYLAAAERGVQSWQRQLNSAKIELNDLSDEIARNDQYIREAGESADGCAHSIDQYGKVVKGAGEASEQLSEGSGKAGAGIEQLAAALAAAGIAKTVKEITDELLACSRSAAAAETSMAKLSTLIDTSVYSIDGIKAQLMELSNKTGVAVGSLAEAAYQARSAGVDTADVVDFVATATKTSIAGFTESATAVDVLTTAINAYKLEGSDAERVASMLVKTQDEGKTSVGELAQNMGRVIPVASAYNVSLGNLTTSYALLTKNGANTAISTTNLTAMLTELAKDGSTVAAVLKEQTGKSFTELAAGGKNLGEIMEILGGSVDGDATAFSNLWSSTTAGQAALSLLNTGAEEFTRTLGVMEGSSGAVERNFQAMADTTEMAHQRMSAAAENLRVAIGDRLNPALENLYDVGADAFTWATDFVNENPEVVGALTAVTVGLGVLTVGVTLAANAENIMTVATGALNTVMSANPAYLVAAGVTALVVAIGTYIATLPDAGSETREFTKSLQESKAAYDELMDAMHQRQADTDTLVASLEDMLAIEGKSAVQKDTIIKLVDQLNEAIPGLGLAYDAEKDALVGLTMEEVKSARDRKKAQEEYEAKQERLAELRTQQAELADRLREAEEELAEAQAQAGEATEEVGSSYAAAAGALASSSGAADQAASSYAAVAGTYDDAGVSAAGFQAAVDELTAAYEDNEAQIAALEAETGAYAQQQAEAKQKTADMTAEMDRLIADMAELEAAYAESYEAAYQSIDSQLGLFNELDGTAKTTIDELIGTLEGQVKYMEDYAANIQKAMELGVDEGLLRKLSDGSEESAQILDAIVKGGGDKVAELNEQFAKVEEGKEQFSTTVAQMESEFDEKMAEVVEDLKQAIQDMDLQDEAYTAGFNNVQGLINGTAEQRKALIDQYTQMGKDALAAYKAAVGQQSPSKEFAKAGGYDIQGVINGAEGKKAELSAAYENLARMTMEGYARGVTENLDKVQAALDELEAAFKRFDSYYSARREISALEYELWERTDGRGVPEMMKYQKKLEALTAQQEDQAAVVAQAQAAYEAVVAQYGAASEESYRFQKTLLEEKLAYQDLLDAVTQVSNAKHKAFIEQEAQRFANSPSYADPYQASAALGTRLVTPDGREFAAAYEDAAQAAVASEARHRAVPLEAPAAPSALERSLESISAAAVNAIAGAAQGRDAVPMTLNLMFPDGTQFASYYFDPMVQYGDANGTPILNPRK